MLVGGGQCPLWRCAATCGMGRFYDVLAEWSSFLGADTNLIGFSDGVVYDIANHTASGSSPRHLLRFSAPHASESVAGRRAWDADSTAAEEAVWAFLRAHLPNPFAAVDAASRMLDGCGARRPVVVELVGSDSGSGKGAFIALLRSALGDLAAFLGEPGAFLGEPGAFLGLLASKRVAVFRQGSSASARPSVAAAAGPETHAALLGGALGGALRGVRSLVAAVVDSDAPLWDESLRVTWPDVRGDGSCRAAALAMFCGEKKYGAALLRIALANLRRLDASGGPDAAACRGGLKRAREIL